MKLLFIAPDPSRFSSGGNLYNHYLVGALHQFGQSIQISEDTGSSSERQDWIIWDTLFLSDFLHLPPSTWDRIILLIHSDSALLVQHLPHLIESEVRFILTGRFLYDHLMLSGIPSERCLLLEPGVLARIPGMDASPGLPVQLMLVSNLTPDKGILAFLETCKGRPAPRQGTIEVHIFGEALLDRNYAFRCLEILQDLNLQTWMAFHGSVSHDSLRLKMRSCHALLSVSPKESYGMAIQEARIAGIPVFAIGGGNVPNLIKHGTDGLLFPSLDLLIDFLWQEFEDPREFLSMIHAFSPRPFQGSAWEDQATRLITWLEEMI